MHVHRYVYILSFLSGVVAYVSLVYVLSAWKIVYVYNDRQNQHAQIHPCKIYWLSCFRHYTSCCNTGLKEIEQGGCHVLWHSM
jgi:hypothetical protein